VVSIVGKSGVGKTTVLERVIREIKQRGYRVGTVKHDIHGFEMDKPGKDSWRHARAGSDAVVVSGPRKMALIRKTDQEMSLDEIVPLMGDVDLVITEGYKRGSKPKIEVSRLERGAGLLCQPEELIGIMADYPLDVPVPRFDLDDATGIVDLLERLYLRRFEETE
jgi:molybdopterin-guanine dinucleotide biosynthesis protein B